MCTCGKPTINGQPGYRWNGETPGDSNPKNKYPVNPPALSDGDVLLHDEPGRCGGLDSHSYHFRVVEHYGGRYLLVRHGGGDERIDLGSRPGLACLDTMNSNDRYWLLQAIYSVHNEATQKARDDERAKWTSAIIQKRIKVRRRNNRKYVEITTMFDAAKPTTR